MIFFDIDGTLLDYDYAEREGMLDFIRSQKMSHSFSERQTLERWKKLSKEYFDKFLAKELSFQEQKRFRMIHLFKMFQIDLNGQEADEKFKIYLSFYRKNWKAYEDVMEGLNQLKKRGYTFGVISNGDYEQQISKLQHLGIEEYFNFIITSSQIGAAKPDKIIFEEACARANRQVKDCYYVGDQLETDALGSKKTGMKGIWLNRKDKMLHPDVIVINSLSELGTLVI